MAQMTKAEAEAQLITVNAAIQQIIEGKRITQLKVGSGSFTRLYTHQEISLEALKELRDELLTIIAVDVTAEETRFNTGLYVPMVVCKGGLI